MYLIDVCSGRIWRIDPGAHALGNLVNLVTKSVEAPFQTTTALKDDDKVLQQTEIQECAFRVLNVRTFVRDMEELATSIHTDTTIAAGRTSIPSESGNQTLSCQ